MCIGNSIMTQFVIIALFFTMYKLRGNPKKNKFKISIYLTFLIAQFYLNPIFI